MASALDGPLWPTSVNEQVLRRFRQASCGHAVILPYIADMRTELRRMLMQDRSHPGLAEAYRPVAVTQNGHKAIRIGLPIPAVAAKRRLVNV
jgi:hypothetical protein